MKKESYIDSDGHELTKNTFSDGSIRYTNKQNECHRTDGPAYEGANGYIAWYKQNKRHRLDEPAVIDSDGYKARFNNGLRHRLDGPAVIWPNGSEFYYLDGKRVTKRDIDFLWLKKQVEK